MLMPVIVFADVIFTMADALRAKNVVQFGATVWLREGPGLDNGEHVTVEFAMRVSNCWVVEHTDDVVEDLIDRNVWVFPGIQNTRGDVLEDCGSYFASRFIQNVGKVVFRREGVGGICAVRVGPGFVLVLSRGVNYRGTTGFELL